MAVITARFAGLNLVANDFDATVGFYRLLGVDIPEDKIWRTASGPHHSEGVPMGESAELEIDSSALACVYNGGYREAPRLPGSVLSFALPTRDAVDALYGQILAAGHLTRQQPFDAFWGARYAVVADPDGRDVGLMSPSDPSRRSAPPDL